MSRPFFARIYLPRRLQPSCNPGAQPAASVPFHEADRGGRNGNRIHRSDQSEISRRWNIRTPRALSRPYKTVRANDTDKSGAWPTVFGGTMGKKSLGPALGRFAMRTTAISPVISHSACGVQRTRGPGRISTRPRSSDSFPFILFSLGPLLAFPPRLGPPILFLSAVLLSAHPSSRSHP